MSAAQVSRIERGLLAHVALEDLARIAAVLGLDLSARLYPLGDPIRDVAQQALLERLRSRSIHRSDGGRRFRCRSPATGARGMP